MFLEPGFSLPSALSLACAFLEPHSLSPRDESPFRALTSGLSASLAAEAWFYGCFPVSSKLGLALPLTICKSALCF